MSQQRHTRYKPALPIRVRGIQHLHGMGYVVRRDASSLLLLLL